ncbi:MAG: hypothetical protein ACRD8A_04190 [Candidatus Acidiferrales bacterium]
MRNGGTEILSSIVLLTAVMFLPGLATGAPQATGNQQAAAKPATNSPLQASSNPGITSQPSKANAIPANGAATSQRAPETDATREQLANFDRFLDTHPVLERELGSNPSLVNDPSYVQREPDLQIFLSHHPGVKAHLERNPQYLAQRVDFAEENATAHGARPDPSFDQAEAGDMREFLGSHDDIKQVLAQNPALIDDSTFLGSHIALKIFLNEHPRARSVFAENPRYFISPAEKPAEAAKAIPSTIKPTSVQPNDGPMFEFGLTPENIGRINQFLEDHPNITKDLMKHPLLVTNHSYLDHHRELRRFFDEHVRVRAAFADDPGYFVPRNGFGARSPTLEIASEAVLGDADLSTTARFLSKHKDIAGELERNPIIVQDLHYLHNHGDLRKFFDEHPRIQTEMDEHPRYFMRREEPVLQKAILEAQKKK